MTSFKQDKAIVSVGRKIVRVASEPAIKEVRSNSRLNNILHFEARGQNNELVLCTAYNDRAVRAVHTLNIGDEVVVDESVEITAIDNMLEYRYFGHFIA